MKNEGEGGVQGNAPVFGSELRLGKVHGGSGLAVHLSHSQLCSLGEDLGP